MSPFRKFQNRLRGFLLAGISAEIRTLQQHLTALKRDLELAREAIGRVETRQVVGESAGFAGAEFQIYSQFGEDGILQYLVNNVSIVERSFIEFGVEDYSEANTKFLLINNHWRGLVMDGDPENINKIKGARAYYRCKLDAVQAFITAENINELISQNGFAGELGVLSVDIDGNDYWVWKAITNVNPAIVVCEYNPRFGPSRSVTIPYDPAFCRSKVMSPPLYYGASLAALHSLGQEKGFALVGCGQNGVNAFFVRHDLLPLGWKAMTPQEAFAAGTYSEFHPSADGRDKKSVQKELEIIANRPLVEV